MKNRWTAILLCAVLLVSGLLAGCTPQEQQTELSTPENQYVVAAALVYYNGALYLRENTDVRIYSVLPESFEPVGAVSAMVSDPEELEQELAAWNLLPGQTVYASKTDPGCVYVRYEVVGMEDSYIRMFRADLYTHWTAQVPEE